ncbi:MAG: OmpA family protein [Gammaproteobacteria bacterium]|nr:OmpA family protein [Gammaproteobacteria bacterium]
MSRVPARHTDTQATHDAIALTESSLAQAGEDEVWMISYMDIMTLLLALFVLLLAYAKVTSVSSPVSQQARSTTHSLRPSATPAAQPLVSSIIEQVSLPMVGISATQRGYITLPKETAQRPVIPPLQAEPETPPVLQEEGRPSNLTNASTEEPPPDASATAPARNNFLETIQASALGTRIEVTAHPDSVNLEISDNILFEPGSATLKPLGRQLLDELAALLVNQNYSVSVEGHTDNIPIENLRFASNWELSSTRATNVTRYLIVRGITAGRLRAIGYADTHPRTDNATAEGRAHNRRVSLVLQLPQG